MSTVDITIADKTYHVDVGSLSARPLQVMVDGQPIEVRIGGNTRGYASREAQQAQQVAPATTKLVKAEVHFNYHSE